ncbi:hypothetical protein DH2020_035812 [Rehmannia glutinosa]|uniref:Uncharacterized protein n=1 Tax=Rehmannia glutinosa TaxID=99300 RepID=A0ABR0V6F2_REHGL
MPVLFFRKELADEKFITDMKNHKVVVTGKVDPHKVLKKLKKKTGKRVELLVEDQNGKDEEKQQVIQDNCAEQVMDSWLLHYYGDSEIHMMFNDENANSCSLM